MIMKCRTRKGRNRRTRRDERGLWSHNSVRKDTHSSLIDFCKMPPSQWIAIVCLGFSLTVSAWVPSVRSVATSPARRSMPVLQSSPVVSPFAERLEDDDDDGNGDLDDYGPANPAKAEGTFELTLENVEMILDEMRPFLISDGGNVEVAEIDGPVVRLQLIGACGSCPSSTMTMKMGLERRLKEASCWASIFL